MKKIWKYIIITLLLLLGLCCVGVLYLFFVPGSSLFNITYINNNILKSTETYEKADVKKIKLNSRGYDVKIIASEDDTISAKAFSNSFGFVLVQNSKFEIDANLDNNILTINVTEPYGFATYNSSYIELALPANVQTSLVLNNKKALTVVDHKDVCLNSLSYTSEKGECKFNQGHIMGPIDLNLNKSKFYISPDVNLNDNEVNLKLTTGTFDAPKSIFGDVYILENERGIINILQCYTIRENQPYAGGQINIIDVGHANITAGDSIINLKNVNDTAIIDLKASGSISIHSLSGDSSISTNSGNIEIGSAESSITLYSESGNITLNNAYLTVVVKIGYGEALINFADDASNYPANSSARVLHAEVKNGKLTANGVHSIGTATNLSSSIIDGGIKISGNGRVYLNMSGVYGINTLQANNGFAHVVINKNSSYTLKTSSQGGNIRVNLTQISEYNGYTTKEERTTNVNCSSSSKLFTATVNMGNLTILDTNFA